MSSDDVKVLVAKVDRLTKVIAIEAVKDRSPDDQVNILNELGFSQTEIAAVTGMSQGNVSKVLKRLYESSSKKVEERGRK
jgi:DNA-directed RNA polymerase specialized sigma24 family protein